MTIKALNRRQIKSQQLEVFQPEKHVCHTVTIGIFSLGDLFQVEYHSMNLKSFDYTHDVDTFQFYDEAKEKYTSLIDDPSHLFN